MSIKVEKTDKTNELKLTFTVEAEKFDEGMKTVYKKTAKYFSIPGFRKGKAPRRIIENNYGKGVFYEDAIDIVFPEVYPSALDELQLAPIDRPSIDVEEISKDNGLVLVVQVEVQPEFELGQYKGIEVAKVDYNVTDEEVDAKLSQIMKDIHDTCVKYGKEGNKINYVKGANIGGFIKVAEAMCAQGHC